MERTLWTYVPTSNLSTTTSEASPSAPVTAASTSACTSPNPDIALWLSSNGKATLRPLSWPGWKTRPWLKRLSGTISEPSMVKRGAAAFISSLPAIRASHSATRASEAGTRIRVTFGPRSPASSTRCDPNGSGARTSKATCPWASPTSPQAYAAWATRQRQACSQREKLAQATGVAASSSWPTPTRSDGGYVPDLILNQGTVRLATPADIPDHSGGQYALNESARAWTTLWLTMKAMGWSAAATSYQSSPQVRVTFKSGNGSFHSTLAPNPQFYELVMGWPTGWTAPEAPVTAFAAWLHRSRGQFSSLLTSWKADEHQSG